MDVLFKTSGGAIVTANLLRLAPFERSCGQQVPTIARTRIKICGITRIEDAQAAVELGADAIGLVFYPPSARALPLASAAAIAASVPAFVSVVGLFVDPDPREVEAALKAVRLSMLQFHGTESREFCARFERPYLKAVPMGAGADIGTYARDYPDCAGLLLDSHGGAVTGGSGKTFDWGRIPPACARPLILAGGLDAGNVTEAVRTVRPYAVDVSSGVEQSRGIKDIARMGDFIAAVRAA